MNILKNKDVVFKLLTENPHLRDDDNKLIATVWYKSLTKNGVDAKQITGFDLLRRFSLGKLPNTKSILRVRRKLQAENPNLQGEKYQVRQKSQDSVIEQLYPKN